jgi:hypothetical protein
MVMCQCFDVRHGIGQVDNSLLLTPRREPYQSLPQDGKNQKSGTAASRHVADSNDFRCLSALTFRMNGPDARALGP